MAGPKRTSGFSARLSGTGLPVLTPRTVSSVTSSRCPGVAHSGHQHHRRKGRERIPWTGPKWVVRSLQSLPNQTVAPALNRIRWRRRCPAEIRELGNQPLIGGEPLVGPRSRVQERRRGCCLVASFISEFSRLLFRNPPEIDDVLFLDTKRQGRVPKEASRQLGVPGKATPLTVEVH